MTLAIWPNKLSLTCIPPNQQHSLAFIHGQNCLSGSRGIQLHKPRDPGGVSPTQASGHRLWTLKWPLNLLQAAPAPLACSLGAPGDHCLRQSPTNKKAFVEAHVSKGKVPAHCWNNNNKKKYKFGHIGEGKNSLTLPTSPSPQGSTAQGQVISPTGENEGM